MSVVKSNENEIETTDDTEDEKILDVVSCFFENVYHYTRLYRYL